MTDFFSGLFDLNGDGRTDWIEQAFGACILDEMMEEDSILDPDLLIDCDEDDWID